MAPLSSATPAHQMPADLDAELSHRLEALQAQGLYRQIRRVNSPQGKHIEIDGQLQLNFASNDYLGFANHPFLKEAAFKAIETYGAGAGASRLICGSLAPHHELEEALANFKGTQAALGFSTGYSAAIGTICALLGKEDVLVADRLVHASIIDAARLCGAKVRVFQHNDLEDLQRILQRADHTMANSATAEFHHQPPSRRTLIVTESVFSMDGDHAPLRQIVELKEKFGAWLMVDEAHATGLYGVNRRGLAEALGVQAQIEIQMGTLGKALGASGGYICGSRVLVDYLLNRARTFVFSTAPVPAAVGAATAGVNLVSSEEGERRRNLLWQRVTQFNPSSETNRGPSAIVPVIIGDENEALEVSSGLRHAGIFVPAIRYPTVARGQARLRITFSAEHTVDEVNSLSTALAQTRAQRPTI